jgi:hypothetical protein
VVEYMGLLFSLPTYRVSTFSPLHSAFWLLCPRLFLCFPSLFFFPQKSRTLSLSLSLFFSFSSNFKLRVLHCFAHVSFFLFQILLTAMLLSLSLSLFTVQFRQFCFTASQCLDFFFLPLSSRTQGRSISPQSPLQL